MYDNNEIIANVDPKLVDALVSNSGQLTIDVITHGAVDYPKYKGKSDGVLPFYIDIAQKNNVSQEELLALINGLTDKIKY